MTWVIRKNNKAGHPSVWYIGTRAFSLNEGGVPNIYVNWEGPHIEFYIRWSTWRLSRFGNMKPEFKRVENWPGWREYWRLSREPPDYK